MVGREGTDTCTQHVHVHVQPRSEAWHGMAGCMALREDGFLAALQWCDPRPGETFIDLGSGTGKAVLAAAATIALESAIGVRIVRELHVA